MQFFGTWIQTKQLDYTGATFVQTPIDCLVYVECLKLVLSPTKSLETEEELLGSSVRSKKFFLESKKQEEDKLGLTQAYCDLFCFIPNDFICLICIDDALLF